MKNALEKRVLLFTFLILAATIVVQAAFEWQSFRRQYRQVLILRCESFAGALGASIEKALALGLTLEEMPGVNARCQEIVVGDPDISYCLVETDEGTPVYANDPSFLSTAGGKKILKVSESTKVLELPRLGKVYDITVPLHQAEGGNAGAVRLGFRSSALYDLAGNIFWRHAILLLASGVSIFILIAYITRRGLVGPISKLCRVSRELAQGNFQVDVPPLGVREFEELGTALKEMAHSLRIRDEKILEGYHELEESNLLLHQSYDEQERTRIELEKNREMYRALIEHASDAIIVTNECDEIVLFNKRSQDLFGVNSGEATGRNFFSLLDRLGVEDVERHYHAHQCILDGESVEIELRFKNIADGQHRIGWIRGSLFDEGGGKKLVQAIIRDFTHEKEVHENLERSAGELLRLNRMKDSFLGLVSHELKTPLTIILGYSDLLLKREPHEKEENFLPMLENINGAAERLNRIVQDMVDVSLIDGDNLRLNVHDLGINALVETAVRNMVSPMEERNQHLELNLNPDLPLVQGDPERLLQMISNLVKNAVKFTPDGGTVSIETRLVASLDDLPSISRVPGGIIDELKQRNRPFIDLVVQDTGIGIPEEQHRHVFEKFFGLGKIEEHSSGQTEFKGKGPGLGLAIVKGIAELHGGEVWLENCQVEDDSVWPGTTFHVMLPFQNESEGAAG
ncbi:MAG TPA: ATP-binding protein, partial [Desulfuromonadales bacterium]|nr:ATP-binding protein [Desulfuromonadales bacterium]